MDGRNILKLDVGLIRPNILNGISKVLDLREETEDSNERCASET